MKKERLTKVLVVGGVVLVLALSLISNITINSRGKEPFGHRPNTQLQRAGKEPFGFTKLLPLNQLGK